MFKWFKYEIAFSVAEEDIDKARLLSAEFKRNKIKYFFYKEHPQNAGIPLLKLITRIYGAGSCIILILYSKDYAQYWSGLEQQVAQMRRKKIIVLRLDDFPLDSYYKNRVYLRWEDGVQSLAITLRKILRPCRMLHGVICLMSAMILLSGLWLLCRPPACSCSSDKKVLVVMHQPSRIVLDSFEISSTEVTVKQFSGYCSANRLIMPKQPIHRNLDNCPVTNITIGQAMGYTRWVGGRLPTSVEWEYAARGNENNNYSGSSDAGEVAVYGRNKFSRVGTKKSNAYGLCDMTGNVSEWCTQLPYIIPDDSVPVRGGAYKSSIDRLKISHIDYLPADTAVSWVGFRVVWDIKQ
jgi:formylglycine-generating enzyme